MTNRVCVMSGGDEVRYRAYVNHAIYARLHDFTYHIGIGLGPAVYSPYYYKFNAILEILGHFEWVLYVDDDVYVTDFHSHTVENLIEQAEERGDFLIIAEGPAEPDGSWTGVNSGVMLLRSDARAFEFLRRSMEADLSAIRASWDEASEGLFTNGDQDAIWRTIVEGDLIDAGVRIVGHSALNSRPYHYRDEVTDAFAVHFCGPGDKRLKIASFGRRFGLGQELVPTSLLEQFSVVQRQVMSPAEMAARRVNLVRRAFEKRVMRKIRFVAAEKRWR